MRGTVVAAGLFGLICAGSACGNDGRPLIVGQDAGGAGGGGSAGGDGCAPLPCRNGGTCSATADGGFACACPVGFAGITCASNVDDCLPNPCRNGATCVDGVVQSRCVCPAGFTGDRCELPRFQPLGATPCGGSAVATGVSADGRTVIGTCGSHAAMLWTAGAGFLDLGISRGTAIDAIPIAVDAGGDAFLSRFRRADGAAGVMRWTAGATMDVLLEPAGAQVSANVASRDLAVIAGAYADATTSPGTQLAFRHTAATGLTVLDVPSGSTAGCGAFGISADGGVLVGACYDAAAVLRAARWRRRGAGLAVELLDVSTGNYASAVSGDGQVIVGYLVSGDVTHQFRFVGDGPMQDIGAPPAGRTASALAASFDGSVIVGSARSTDYPFPAFATVWDRTNGMRVVADVLAAAGIETSGWTLSYANLVSDDGRVIVGNGTGPDGIDRFWLARLY